MMPPPELLLALLFVSAAAVEGRAGTCSFTSSVRMVGALRMPSLTFHSRRAKVQTLTNCSSCIAQHDPWPLISKSHKTGNEVLLCLTSSCLLLIALPIATQGHADCQKLDLDGMHMRICAISNLQKSHPHHCCEQTNLHWRMCNSILEAHVLSNILRIQLMTVSLTQCMAWHSWARDIYRGPGGQLGVSLGIRACHGTPAIIN